MGLLNQELLGQSDTWKRVLFQLPDRELQDRMDATWRSDSRRASAAADVNLYRWQQLEATTRAAAKKNVTLRKAVEEIVFAFTYPRLDLEVSKHMNHLLKAPFCVHPKTGDFRAPPVMLPLVERTGAVCVPIDPANCADFEPSQAPTLNQQVDGIDAAHGASDLMNEINAAHRESDGAAAAPTGRPPCLNSPSLSSTVLPRPSLPSQLMNEINAAHRGPDGAAAAAMGKGSLPLFLLLTFLTSTLISVLRFVPCRYSGAFDVQYVDF
ncbi:unnamed protein product [Closterium sp. NIES-64]|nr:unnamed protein product [Closterium sp. NIES-64]